MEQDRFREVLRIGLIVAGVIAAAFIWQAVVFGVPNGGDGWSYWQAPYAHPYDRAARDELLSYLYSPAFLQVLAPLKLLTFDTFNAVWVALLLAATILLAGPLAVFVLLAPPILQELEVGNVHILLGLAIALGFRYPATYAFGLLTKVTPGFGLVWFAVRREWRALSVVIVVTAGIVAVSWLLAPDLWAQWLVVFARPTVRGGALLVPLVVRAPLGLLIVAWGARTDRWWAVPVAVTVALPNLWFNGLAVLLGAMPLLAWERLPQPFATILRPIFDGRPSRTT